MFKLSKTLSFQVFSDRTYLLNHKTKQEFLMNKDAGTILENIEKFTPSTLEEIEFIKQLKELKILETENSNSQTDFQKIKNDEKSDIYAELKNFALKNAIPINCTMEITQHCELNCQHCYLKGLRKPQKNELSTQEIKNFINQFKQLGGTFLTITGGDPFLRKDLLEIIKYAREKYIAVSILTSGNFFTTTTIDELAKLSVHRIQYSLYGPNKETHDFITQTKGSFEKTLKAINYSKNKLNTHIALSINTLNFKHCKQFIEFIDKIKIPYSINYTMFPFKKTNAPSPFNLTTQEISYCLKTTKNATNGRFFNKKPEDFVCNAGRSLFSIDPFGNIKPCIEIPETFGNIKEKPLKEILQLIQKSKYILKIKDLEDCNNCKFKNYCNRCTGLAIQEKLSEKQHSKLDCTYAKALFSVQKENFRNS